MTAVDDRGRHRGGGHLDRGDLRAGALGAVAVDQPGGLEHQQPALLDLDAGAGDEVTDDTVLGERPTERHPGLRPFDHEREGEFGHPGRAHGVMDAAGVGLHRDASSPR